MADSSLPDLSQDINQVVMELDEDLERMIENVETISVQLTWMAYDMVAMRTSPDLESSMQKLEEACDRCRAAVFGEEQPDDGEVPDPM
ncbi:synaptonemal complex central element protein 3 [Halichoeres trimaculatus]|uniref:synaptonemal complex central element protein 3 n=1 Tax=Halichoeres trimaculatus TaxID=147232 RepID=UPI003D9E9F01